MAEVVTPAAMDTAQQSGLTIQPRALMATTARPAHIPVPPTKPPDPTPACSAHTLPHHAVTPQPHEAIATAEATVEAAQECLLVVACAAVVAAAAEGAAKTR